jgi:prevent-host-death family protein
MEVGVLEAKNRFSELLDRAERGEQITITRHGKAVATMNPSKPARDPEAFERLVQENAAARSRLPKISREEIAEAIKADRRF